MLKKLIINNYALIDRLELDFDAGLSVITGETGAGKSIMLGAISLLLGARADTKALRKPDEKIIVEAVFSKPGQELESIIEKFDLEWDEQELIIRREISSSGRSRAFINDSPVTLQALQELAPLLIDIHSQHQTLHLLNSRHQLAIIDVMANNNNLVEEYRKMFDHYIRLRRKYEEARREIERNRENSEFIRFQLEQLDKLNPKPGELEEVERRFELLSDAGEIKEQLSLASGLTGGYDTSALSLLTDVKAALGHIDFTLVENEKEISLPQRLESLYIELKDIYETLEGYASEVEDDPIKLAKTADRMERLYDAQKRFKVNSHEELIAFHACLKKSSVENSNPDESLASMDEALRSLARSLKEKAIILNERRIKAAKEFSELLTVTAQPLGLPNLKFSAMVSKGKLHSDGMDQVSFLCRFNKNQELMPLEKAASGGEMSRLMLSLKAILSSRLRQPTVIFDEIDTGVSGEIADRMGRMMRKMAKDTQVIAITHLPQVASKGINHYRVYKTDVDDSTISHVERLSDEERQMEIAKMLSGDKVDEAARINAASLLENSRYS